MMFFRSASLLLALAVSVGAKTIVPDFDVKADSKFGQRLLSKARALNEERDVTWVAKYSIKYRGCSSMVQLANEANGGQEDGLLYTQNLVKFSLCPSDSSCESCKGGGDYVVNMMEFLDAWTENKMNTLEQICENIRENCYCNNQYNDDQACENQCFADAEMTECIQYEGEEEFELQRYLECAEMEDNGNNNNNNNGNNQNGNYNGQWYGQYFIGPYCNEKDGFSIHLGVFYDEGCSARADSSEYANRNYGMELPYAYEPIVEEECISCMQVDDNNNNNNQNQNQNNNNNYYYYQDLEVNELCDQVYELAAKCETNIDVNWPDTSGCEYIQNILPRLEKATRGVKTRTSGESTGGAAVGFAWVFAITTVIFASYAFFLYRKLDRNRVDLSSSDGALA